MSTPKTSRESELVFETLHVRKEGAVLFAEISAPPMNLEGPELARDLVSLIQQAEADIAVQVLVFKSADPLPLASTLLNNRRAGPTQSLYRSLMNAQKYSIWIEAEQWAPGEWTPILPETSAT